MGEYAEIQLARDISRGFKYTPRERNGRNPIVMHCPICGKGTRAVAGDKEEGLRSHMKAKHKAEAAR